MTGQEEEGQAYQGDCSQFLSNRGRVWLMPTEDQDESEEPMTEQVCRGKIHEGDCEWVTNNKGRVCIVPAVTFTPRQVEDGEPIVYQAHDHQLVIRPTSCRCGGDWAWLMVHPNGMETMLGCICHTAPMDAIDRLNHPTPPRGAVYRTRPGLFPLPHPCPVGCIVRLDQADILGSPQPGDKVAAFSMEWIVTRVTLSHYYLQRIA